MSINLHSTAQLVVHDHGLADSCNNPDDSPAVAHSERYGRGRPAFAAFAGYLLQN